jgi:hypothetical protein
MGYRGKPCPDCPKNRPGKTPNTIERVCKRCWACHRLKMGKDATARAEGKSRATQTVQFDQDLKRARTELTDVRRRYTDALDKIHTLETTLAAAKEFDKDIDTFEIVPREGTGTSEATCVWVASDWHVEERVDPKTINGLNEYSLAIAKNRAVQFFQNGLRLTDLLAQDVKIHTVVLALLGDFISNDIHDEFPEINETQPMHAIGAVQEFIASGIQYVLDHSAYQLVIPCHSGNHARTTKTTRFGAENGHSLEYLMYRNLQNHFRFEPRVTFLIAEGMHSYLPVYDKVVRFHHGHAVRYAGGVGGIYIPVNKAIAQWDRARRADIDVFGHFHQLVDGGKFLCNGSMIGYNSFALSIKASYEPPRQALFLIDKKRGRTCTWPILFDEKVRKG